MRSILLPRGRGRQQVLALIAAPALVVGLTQVASPTPATASHGSAEQEAASTSPAPYVSKKVSSNSSRVAKLQAYWTPKRMANATPINQISTGDDTPAQTPSGPAPMKPSTGSQPVAPAGPATAKIRKSRTIGKVFFRTKSGENAVCSGSAVNSKGKNMVMTAGHCVFLHGWSKKWVFVPGFGPRNIARNGIYPATELVALKGWIKHEKLSQDVAIALVKPGRGTNKKLVKKVGGFGVQFGRKYSRKLTAVGYSSAGYRGDDQKHCRKRTHRRGHARQIVMRCKVLTAGASGGPWVKGRVANGRGYVNGVNSTADSKRHPTVIRTSYFGKPLRRMYMDFRKKGS